MPDQFSRVISWIGSFASIQWKEDPAVPDGGQDYPDKVLREPKRNIRVWLQDGSNDLEKPNYGSWPLANLRMANALKTRDYDFHFSFGKGTHNSGHGAARVSRGDDLAVAGLRPGEDRAEVHEGPGGEEQAAISSHDYQPGCGRMKIGEWGRRKTAPPRQPDSTRGQSGALLPRE